jgi:SSS family solute:Na+ symporter
MILNWIDWSIIIAFMALSWYLSTQFHRRKIQNLNDYFLGGRDLPWYVAGISMVATTFAADTPLAVAEIVAISGISGNWIWWNALAGGLLTAIFFAKLWHRSGVLTEAELIELRYSGPAAKFLRRFKGAYLGLFMNALVIGWVNLAMISIVQVLLGLSSDQAFWVVAGLMLFVTFYSTISGLRGIAIVDVLQFTLAMIGSFLLSWFVLASPEVGGLDGIVSKLEDKGTLNFFPQIGASGDNSNSQMWVLPMGSFIGFMAFQWWASWYPGSEPGGGGYVAQRMMSTRTDQDALKATVLFQVLHYCVRPWPWILVGLAAIILYPEIATDEKRLGFVYTIRDFLPTGAKGLLAAAFLGAYMSTISTQLNWGAGMIANDVLMVKDKDEKTQLKISRFISLALAVVALFVTTQLTSIKVVWEFVFQAGAGLGLVLILRWYWWRINVYSELSATLTPFIVYAWLKYTDSGIAYEASLGEGYNYIFVVGITTIVWLVCTFLTPAENKSTLNTFYQRVKPNGAWSIVGHKVDYKDLSKKFATWIGLTILVYTVLFSIGYLLLR